MGVTSPYWKQHADTLCRLVASTPRTRQGHVQWAAIAAQMPEPRPNATACRMKWKHGGWAGVGGSQGHSDSKETAFGPTTTPPALTAAPFAVPIPGPPVPHKGGMVAVVLPDTHFPVHDPKAVAVAKALVREAQPDLVLHIGDLLDAHWLSRFDKNPDAERLQEEIDRARTFLHQIAQLAPQARRVLLAGNHEDRLTKAIWSMPGTASAIGTLTRFRQEITWPKLLGLDEIGWEWISTAQQSRTEILPGLITKHGSVVRKWSGQSGCGEWQKYGRSGVSGHSHRLGAFYHRDHNGSHVWIEAGCLCQVDPDYTQDPDWQQGVVVLTYNADGTRFNPELIYIQDGRAVWRGREFVA